MRGNRNIFFLTNLLALVSSLGFYFSNSAATLLIAYAGMGFTHSPTATNLDTWLLKRLGKDGRASYGSIRSMGSLGYGVSVFFIGMVIASVGYSVMPIFVTISTAATLFIAYITKDENANGVKQNIKIDRDDLMALFKNVHYLFLMLILFFDGFAMMSVQQMKILIWEDMGASIAYQGYDGFFMALAQTPMFFLASRMSRFDPYKRLAVGVGLDLLMFGNDYLASVPQLIIFGSVLSGFAYGLNLSAMWEIIIKITPSKLQTTAQGLGDAAYVSISAILGSLVAGMLVDALGVKSMILTCFFVQLIPATLIIIYLLRMRKHPIIKDT